MIELVLVSLFILLHVVLLFFLGEVNVAI